MGELPSFDASRERASVTTGPVAGRVVRGDPRCRGRAKRVALLQLRRDPRAPAALRSASRVGGLRRGAGVERGMGDGGRSPHVGRRRGLARVVSKAELRRLGRCCRRLVVGRERMAAELRRARIGVAPRVRLRLSPPRRRTSRCVAISRTRGLVSEVGACRCMSTAGGRMSSGRFADPRAPPCAGRAD